MLLPSSSLVAGRPFLVALLTVACAAAPASAGQRERDQGQSEHSVTASRGSRLEVDNQSGSIAIKTWDRDVVQVRAKHASSTQVDVRDRQNTIHVETEARNGAPGSADLDITIPKWMAVRVESVYAGITVTGSEAEIEAETVRGPITIDGGTGFVHAESVEGRVTITNARARLEASSVNDGVEIQNVEGAVEAETTNGGISLLRMKSANVRAETVNGDITYDGTIAADGHYSFVTHNGDIDVAMPPNASVTMGIRTYNGAFTTDLQLKTAAQSGRGRRMTLTLGSGSAAMELETFGGGIRVHRPGAAPPASRER